MFKLGGEFYAYLNHCPHMGGPACQGKMIAKVEEIIADDRTSKGMMFSKTQDACGLPVARLRVRHPHRPSIPAIRKARLRKIKVAVSDGDVVITVPDAREHVPVMQEADISVSRQARDDFSFVMPGLVPGIHVFLAASKTWIAGTSPAMTSEGCAR